MPRRSPQTQKRVDLTPGRPGLAKSGEFPAVPPRNRAAGDLPPPLARPTPLRRPIRIQRARLDLGSIRSRPSDPDPAARNRAYRFGPLFLHKSPQLPRNEPALHTSRKIFPNPPLLLRFRPWVSLKYNPPSSLVVFAS